MYVCVERVAEIYSFGKFPVYKAVFLRLLLWDGSLLQIGHKWKFISQSLFLNCYWHRTYISKVQKIRHVHLHELSQTERTHAQH